jgi:hypothetical protein
MKLRVNHEVAPKEMAFGMDSDCADCHASDAIDWAALGWTADPFDGGERIDPEGDAVLDWFPPMSLGRTVD